MPDHKQQAWSIKDPVSGVCPRKPFESNYMEYNIVQNALSAGQPLTIKCQKRRRTNPRNHNDQCYYYYYYHEIVHRVHKNNRDMASISDLHCTDSFNVMLYCMHSVRCIDLS